MSDIPPNLVPFEAHFPEQNYPLSSHPALQSGFLRPEPPASQMAAQSSVSNIGSVPNMVQGPPMEVPTMEFPTISASQALPMSPVPAAMSQAPPMPMDPPRPQFASVPNMGQPAPPMSQFASMPMGQQIPMSSPPMNQFASMPMGQQISMSSPPMGQAPTMLTSQFAPVPNMVQATMPPNMGSLLVESLQQLNMELVVKLERSNASVVRLEKERGELLDRLEKSLKVSVALKSVEADNGDLRANFRTSESALRVLFEENKTLKAQLEESSEALRSLRSKYFVERERNDEISQELERVTTVSELAKQAVDAQSSRAELRDLQLRTLRSLVEEGTVVEAPKTNIRNAAKKISTGYEAPYNFSNDELDMATQKRGGMQITDPRDWHNTPLFTGEHRDCAILLSGSHSIRGNIFRDKFISLSFETASNDFRFVATNVSPSIVQQVRLLDCSPATSAYQFELAVAEPVWLKPGQSKEYLGSIALNGVFDRSPVVCLSYLPSDGLVVNSNITVPIVMAKFLTPSRLPPDALLQSWSEFERFQVTWKWSQKVDIATLMAAGELGGSLSYQRGIDPNPRGFVFAGTLSGGTKEVLVRIEQMDAMIRVCVRSPLIALSHSVATTISQILRSR